MIASINQASLAQDWTLPIERMTCTSCVARVERSLRAVPGVAEATVNLAIEAATVRGDTGVGVAELAAAVEKAGYTVGEQTLRLAIDDMTCASCVARVETALKSVPGVRSAEMNLATECATVRAAAAGIDALRAAVKGLARRSGRKQPPTARAVRTPAVEVRAGGRTGGELLSRPR